MAKKIDPREDSVILVDMALQLEEFDNGKPVGENARIPVITENFSWKRSFVNCWTGWPNDGKSTYFMFMALMKSIVDGWKWCFWSPEMYNAVRDSKGKMMISASDLIDELIFMKTGKSTYKHFENQYGIKQIKKDEYVEVALWIQEHFKFVNLKERKFKSLLDNFRYVFEVYGVDGFLVDPFKSMDHSEEAGRFDLYLDKNFADTKEFALETDTSINFIAHPRNDKDPKNADGSYKLCSQFMLAGGASWNNNMDGIYSIYRPHKHKNPDDPRVTFFNLKQRKQQLVGRCGMYDKIEFDFSTNRYFFDGHCPIDGSYKEPLEVSIKRAQERRKEEAAFAAANKGKKKDSIAFQAAPEPIQNDFELQEANVHETLF